MRTLDARSKKIIVDACMALARQAKESPMKAIWFDNTGSSNEQRLPKEFSSLKARRLVIKPDWAKFSLQFWFDSGVDLVIKDLDTGNPKAELIWGDYGDFRETVPLSNETEQDPPNNH